MEEDPTVGTRIDLNEGDLRMKAGRWNKETNAGMFNFSPAAISAPPGGGILPYGDEEFQSDALMSDGGDCGGSKAEENSPPVG